MQKCITASKENLNILICSLDVRKVTELSVIPCQLIIGLHDRSTRVPLSLGWTRRNHLSGD